MFRPEDQVLLRPPKKKKKKKKKKTLASLKNRVLLARKFAVFFQNIPLEKSWWYLGIN